MDDERLWTCTEVARPLGIEPRTVSDLATSFGAPERKHPHNGLARGLNETEVKAVRAAVAAGRRVMKAAARSLAAAG